MTDCKHIYCPNPYILAEIMPFGNVYPCSCGWIKGYSFGNIFEQSFDEIWNGEKAREFREKLYNNDFSLCPGCQNLEILSEIKDKEPKLISEPPERVLLGLDEFCDVRCIFCRDENYKVNPNLIPADKKDKLLEILTPWLQHAKYVKTNAVGEVFASKISRDLIKDIANAFPHIKFEIITNGIHCTKENIEKLNIADKISMMTISLHAIKEDTYNKLVKGGNYKKVIENINYLSSLKKNGKIERFEIHFTVTNLNYKEIPEMVDFCRKNNANLRLLGLDCSRDLEKTYNKLNIQDKKHPEYNNLVKLTHSRKFKEAKDVVIQGYDYFVGLEPASFWNNLKNKLKSIIQNA